VALDDPASTVLQQSTRDETNAWTNVFADTVLTCDFLLAINPNLAPILHRFRGIAFDRSKIAIFDYTLVFNSPDGGVSLRRSP